MTNGILKNFIISKLFLLSLVFLAFYSCDGPVLADDIKNWEGLQDTARIDSFNALQLLFGRAFPLTEGEDIQIIMKVDDSTQAGFANDSTKFHWGFQTGSLTKDTAGNVDTIFQGEDIVVLDTCLTDSFGLSVKSTQASNGVITKTLRGVDTSSVTGWAIQRRWAVPEWGLLIRPWVQGLAVTGSEIGNLTGEELVLEFQINRRIGTQIIRK